MEKMATLTEAVYGKLLSQARPRVIKTEAENERALTELEALDTLGRPLTREEEALADLLTVLVQQFEEHLPANTSWYFYGIMTSLRPHGALPATLVQTSADGEAIDMGDRDVDRKSTRLNSQSPCKLVCR